MTKRPTRSVLMALATASLLFQTVAATAIARTDPGADAAPVAPAGGREGARHGRDRAIEARSL